MDRDLSDIAVQGHSFEDVKECLEGAIDLFLEGVAEAKDRTVSCVGIRETASRGLVRRIGGGTTASLHEPELVGERMIEARVAGCISRSRSGHEPDLPLEFLWLPFWRRNRFGRTRDVSERHLNVGVLTDTLLASNMTRTAILRESLAFINQM